MTIRTELKSLGNNQFEVMGYVDDTTAEGTAVEEGGLFELGAIVEMKERFDQIKRKNFSGKRVKIGGRDVEIHGTSYSCIKHKNKKLNVPGDCIVSVSPVMTGGKGKTRKSKKSRKSKKTRKH